MSKESRKLWQLNNRDKMKQYSDKFRTKEGFKEHKSKYDKKYNTENRDKQLKYQRNYNSQFEDGLHSVYITKDNYAGITNNSVRRAREHKHQNNTNYPLLCVIYKTPNRNEALELESLLHDMGYRGKHIPNKKL